MTEAYLFFCRPLNQDTATHMIAGMRTLIGERDAQGDYLWDSFRVSIACGGGNVIAGFALYNEIVGMEITVDTHNAGAVDSAAIMPFMAGKRRTASERSGFLFHQTIWTFEQLAQTQAQMADAARWVDLYDHMMAETVASRTKLSAAEVLRMMKDGASLTPKEALDVGLIHAVEECRTPRDARSWQV